MREMSEAELEAFLVRVMEAATAAAGQAFEAQHEVNRVALGGMRSLAGPSRAELADAIGSGVAAGVARAFEDFGLLKARA